MAGLAGDGDALRALSELDGAVMAELGYPKTHALAYVRAASDALAPLEDSCLASWWPAQRAHARMQSLTAVLVGVD